MAKKTSKGTAGSGLRGLRGAAKSPSSKTSTMPVVKIPDELQAAMAQWTEAKLAEGNAKSKRELAEGELLETARAARLKQCISDRALHASIKIVAGTGDNQQSLKATQQGRTLKMPAEKAEAPLMAIFGAKFSTFFRVTEGISVCDNISPELEKRLTDCLTEKFSSEEIGQMLEFDPQVKATEQFFSDSVLNSEIRGLAEKAREEKGLCMPIKMSFGIVK